MAKTLKDILEVAKPVSPADKEFVAKHIIKKTPDANKNGDDVFNATNTKVHKRSPNHGYDAGADEKAYDIKCSNTAAGVVCPVHGDSKCPGYMKESARSLSDILGEAKAATLSALVGKKEFDYKAAMANYTGPVTKLAPVELDDKEKAKLSATFGKGGGKGSDAQVSSIAPSYSDQAKKAAARRKLAKEEVELDEAAMKYAQVDPKDVKKVLAAHRATGEPARHMGDGKIAYSGKKLVTSQNESYEELDEGAAKDQYDMHHKRAMAALNDMSKHLIKQKGMTDKSDNKWAHADQAFTIKDIARQLEDMSHSAAQRTENMMPMPMSQNNIRGYY